MKVASLFIFFAFSFLYLSHRSDKKFLISHRAEKSPERSIATGESAKCMRDLFSVEVLKKEIQELESSLDTNRITGQWRNIDLSELPTPAADFLKVHGDKISTTTNQCGDVPCLYNDVYGTPDGIAGYVHYLWFLRTGIYLAADNLIPNQASSVPGEYNGKSFPVSSYLFDEDELYGFWRLSKMLTSPYSTLTYLKEIQRIPRGEKMEGANAVACGLAHSDGWITLNDQCLVVYQQSDSGYFFPAVLHEMSHQVDFEEGRRLTEDLARSDKEDFLTLSGFELLEYRNSAGQTVRQWSLKPDAKLVTMYARNSPAENFAELLSYYRNDGDGTKKKVKQNSWEFAGGYFHEKSFEFQEISDNWIQSASSLKTRELFKTALSCQSEDCLLSQINSLVSEEIGNIRSQDPDGCRVLSNPYIAQTLPGKLNAEFRKVASSSEVDPDVKKAIIDRYDELMNPNVAYESFFNCHDSGPACYEGKVREGKASEFSEFGEVSEKLNATYLRLFSYEAISREIRGFYQSLLSSRDGVMKAKADQLWESCKKIPSSDNISPSGTDYVLKDGYMVSSFYNCINRGFRSTLNGSLDAVKLKEFTPKNTSERDFIISLMKPRLSEIFDEHVKSGRVWELKYRDAFVEQQGTWLYSSMRTNRWWLPRGRVDQTQIETACKENAIKMIGGDIYFHLKKELYQDLLEKTCKGIK